MLKTILKYLGKMIRREIPLIDGWYFIQGHTREILFYSKFKFLIRRHIKEQIEFRFKVMDKECFAQGSCKICGCSIPALTMSNKECDKPCYPPMLSKKKWKKLYNGEFIVINTIVWEYDFKTNQLTKL